MTEISQTSCAIIGLVSRFVEKPDAIRLELQQTPAGDCYWMMKGDPEDEAKLIGKSGSHVKALTFLIAQIGHANRRAYSFRLITEGAPAARPTLPPRDVMTYDVEPTRELLVGVLSLLELGRFAVDVGPGEGPRTSLTFVFTIQTTDALDYQSLTVAPDATTGETTIGAIGTLFRAIAKKDGVRFQINVTQ